MQFGKIAKWSAGLARVVYAKLKMGRKLTLPKGGKPVYFGRGVRLSISKGGCLELERGVYIDDYCRIEVFENARVSIGANCYFNTNCRVVACEEIDVGDRTMIGPNVCLFDHDHLFNFDGVHSGVLSSPITIGRRCWVGANTLITKGVSISSRICVGGGSVVSRSLTKPGVYVGAPAHFARDSTGRSC